MVDSSSDGSAADAATIVLIAGPVKVPDRIGHHDYLAGCTVLAGLIEQTPGLRAIVVRDGWPDDDAILDAARGLVVYAGGGRKLPLLASAQRIARIQRLIDRGIGVVMLHQAVSCMPEFRVQMASWLGGAHVAGESARGHWRTRHREFPVHPVTRGVQAWETKDGWLNDIRFVDGMRGITPLVWSGRAAGGAAAGGTADIVGWTYDRPNGGRSFGFTGLDAHSAWSAAGVRQLVVNATLWSAGLTIPAAGAPCAIDDGGLQRCLTPRGSRFAWAGKLARRGLRRLTRA